VALQTRFFSFFQILRPTARLLIQLPADMIV
jgi:hypothetical protein